MTTIELQIIKIVVITGSGADQVILHTTLPDGCWPYSDNANLNMYVASGKGEKYVKLHFPGIFLEVIKI